MVPAGSASFKKSIKVKGGKVVSDFPLIVHATRPKAWAEWSRSSGIELPDDAKITRLDSMIAVVRAAERGLGAALVPVELSQGWFDGGSLSGESSFRLELVFPESDRKAIGASFLSIYKGCSI